MASAKMEFFDSVDAKVIAHARHHDLDVVTHEVAAPTSKRIVKIPDVCEAIGVRYLNTFDALAMLHAKFSYDPFDANA
jgi:hypothetical protein